MADTQIRNTGQIPSPYPKSAYEATCPGNGKDGLPEQPDQPKGYDVQGGQKLSK